MANNNHRDGSLYSLFYYKLLSNSFKMNDSTKALYDVPSYINHSCVPNAYHVIDPVSGCFYLKAFRYIKSGEEITISYVNALQGRKEHLTKRGIHCECEHCR